MEVFEKKLLWMCKKEMKFSTILLTVVALLFAGLGAILYFTEYEAFCGTDNGYAKMDVRYVMGPFAWESEEEQVTCEYYVAEDRKGAWYVLGIDPLHELPIYGGDVFEEDLEGLEPQTVYGYSTEIPEDLVPYLVEFFEAADWGLTEDNYQEFFGYAYLDATDENAKTEGTIFFVLAVLFLLLAAGVNFSGGMKKRKVKAQLDEMSMNGTLKKLYEDFQNDRGRYYRSLKIAVSPHYVLDYVGPGGIDIIALDDVVNAFKCNMTANGCPISESFIALETEEGKRIRVATSKKAGSEFNNALMQIKRIISGGEE